MRQKKKGVKKKKKEVPMRESNPRPLNLQTLKSVAIVSPHMRIYDQTSRIYIYIIYIANLDCHDLNVSALAALAPPTRFVCTYPYVADLPYHCVKACSL